MSQSDRPIDPRQVMTSLINSGECPTKSLELKACSHPLRTPHYLTGAMVSLMKQYFGSKERIALEKATFLWDKSAEKSEVYISDEFNWDFREVGSRPAIIVELGDFSSIEEIPTLGKSGLIGYDPKADSLAFAAIENGTFSFRCVAKQKLEAWSLSWEVKTLLQSYAEIISAEYDFQKFRVASVTRPQKMEEADEYKVSTVSVAFNMIDAWALTMENLKVQTIDTTYSLDTQEPTYFRGDEP